MDTFDHLPSPLSTFIGRKREIEEVRRLLGEHRLLTLTGSGGCGKTRLAIQVAHELQGVYQYGVCFVELAGLLDTALLPETVASQFGVREAAGTSISASLITHLQPRELLLVLDNCEHLVEACARLSALLLENCPGLRLLATSRERLAVPGEVVWLVPPLSLPDPQPWQSPDNERKVFSAYEESEAVQLFTARAKAAWPGFSLTRQNAGWVADVCRRLDGMPLAIELAAARVRAFSVQEISERLRVDYHLLAQGPRTAQPRQRTLEATLDWSHALLSPEEQTVLRRLSVFMGGWTMEAAEEVVAFDFPRHVCIETHASLVDKSLIAVDRQHGETRYLFLETVRMYALEKLEEAGETKVLRDLHLAFILRWAEQGDRHLRSPAQQEWVSRFDAEHENIRAALHWGEFSEDRAEASLRLAAACAMYWNLRGFYREGRARFDSALGGPGARRPTMVRARALQGAGSLAYLQSDYPAARALEEESLAIYRSLGEDGRAGAAWVLEMLAEVATEVGDYELVPDLMEESLATFRELNQRDEIAQVLLQFGWAAMRAGEYERASLMLEEGLELLRELGNTFQIGLALAGSGELAVRLGDYDQAAQFLEESLSLRRELGNPWGVATSLGSLGWVALMRRDFDELRSRLRESLQIRQEIGDPGGIAWCLEKLAEAIILEAQVLPARLRRKELRRAARVYGAAEALRAPIGSVIDPADQPGYDAIVAGLQAKLGEKVFAESWAEGEGQSLQESIEDALALPDNKMSLTAAQAAKASFGGLSSREREVAVLISRGKTNREIAEALTVGNKTVETYVTRILNKLGLQTRVQIATWALEVGIEATYPG